MKYLCLGFLDETNWDTMADQELISNAGGLRFYERLVFNRIEDRTFGNKYCYGYRLERSNLVLRNKKKNVKLTTIKKGAQIMHSMKPVVHFEIPIDDLGRAKKFYSSVFDWDLQDMPFEDDIYTFAITSPVDENYKHKENGAINGGIYKRNQELSTPIITIGVPSIDEYLKKIETAGGNVVVPKGEVPDMGYYAYFKDTEGNVMGIWESMKKG